MPTPWIVKPFDVIEHVRSRFISGYIAPAVGSFSLQAREEALHRRGVPAVAPPAHATADALIGKQSLELLARGLAAPARMGPQRPGVSPPPHRHPQPPHHQPRT